VEDSVHYDLTNPAKEDEWIYHEPFSSEGVIRLGPQHRPLYLSLLHQVHCVRDYNDALTGHLQHTNMGHSTHCLNYLREWILCNADLTLEDGDLSERDFDTQRQGGNYVCRDWKALWGFMEGNWEEWQSYSASHNIGPAHVDDDIQL